MSRVIVVGSRGAETAAAVAERQRGGVVLEIDECLSAVSAESERLIVGVADYLDGPTLRRASAAAGRLSRTWYRYNGSDLTSYKGVSLGEIAETRMYRHFGRVLQGLLLADRCLTRHVPEEVVYCGGESAVRGAFQHVSSQKGIRWAEPLPPGQDATVVGSASKTIAAGRAFRKVARGLSENAWRYLPAMQRARIAVRQWWRRRRLVVMATPFYSANWLIDDLRRDRRFHVVELDRQKIRSLDWVRLNYLTPEEWRRIEGLAPERRRHYERLWLSLEDDCAFRDLFRFEGLSLWELVRKELRELILSSWRTEMLVEAQRAILAIESPDVLLFVMPFGGGQRTLVHLAHMYHRIHAALYPEGAYFLHDHDYPLCTKADSLLLWGAASADLFKTAGFRKGQLKVIGHRHPSGPGLTGAPRRIFTRVGTPVRRKIVYFDSPPSSFYLGITCRLMQSIARVMERLPDCDLVFRPHPRFDDSMPGATARRFAFVRELRLPNVRMADHQQASLTKVIAATDIAITLGSSVIYDLLVADRPVVLPALLPWNNEPGREASNIPEMELTDPTLLEAVFTVRSLDELVETVRRILEHPEVWREKQAARQRFVAGQADASVDVGAVLSRLAHTKTPGVGTDQLDA